MKPLSVRRTLRQAAAQVVAGAGIAALLLSAPAYADELGDVTRLMRAGKAAEAMNKTNEYLAKRPNDPQLRFMKGVLLTEQNKTDEAIAVFTRLTEDFKDLPEPYNNLAVLYAATGQYDKARVTLEKAIRTNPSYMTAYENLGDVYGKMASQAYDKALALGSTPPSKSKLTLLRTFSSSTGSKVTVPEAPAQAPVQVAQAGQAGVKLISPLPEIAKTTPMQRIPSLAVTPPAAVAPAPVVVAKAAPVPAPVPAPVLAAKAAPRVAAAPALPKPPATAAAAVLKPAPAATPVLAAKPEAPKAAPVAAVAKAEPAKAAPVVAVAAAAVIAAPAAPAKPAVKPAVDNSEQNEVENRVNGWAKAWTAQDVDAYLGYYSNEFDPPKGLSRKAWSDERRARIAGKGHIRVLVSGMQVAINGNTAKVSFRQVYESDRLSANSRKTLLMVKHGGKWQIKQETSGG